MNPDPAVYNYALLRCLPYAETGEFVNVGVVVASIRPATFDFWMDIQEAFARVHSVFPEIDQQQFEAGYAAMGREFERIKTHVMETRDPKLASHFFQELVRPRESLFRFGEIRTASGLGLGSPSEELFHRYVLRASARLSRRGSY